MGQTIYVIFDDHENPMGCSCCRYEGPEYIHEIYLHEENAKARLVEMYLEKMEDYMKGYDDPEHEPECYPIISEDETELWWYYDESQEVCGHRFFINAMEAR